MGKLCARIDALSPRQVFGLMVLGVVGLVLTAVVLEHGVGVLPCKMCWWQRYIHWGIGGAAFIGWWITERRMQMMSALVVAALALAGLYIAGWQYAAQHGWLPFPASCVGDGIEMSAAVNLLDAMQRAKIVPCDKETFRLFGLSLAGWNIPVMLGYLVAGVWVGRKAAR